MEILTQLNTWLSELLYRTDDIIEDHFQIIPNKYKRGKEEDYRVYFYTRDNRYCVVAKHSSTKEMYYLGCTVSTRKPRAGEDWNRGNDLPDGKFNEATWERIKNAIISYELVKIAKKERAAFDVEVETKPSERRGSKPETRPLH